MANNFSNQSEENTLTPEEVEEMTGEDIEDIRSAEHPDEALMDVDNEGTGVDEPDLSSGAWDDEIEPEDREDFRAAKIDFEELTGADREIYLDMVALREEKMAGSDIPDFAARLEKLERQCVDSKAGLASKPRVKFLGIVEDKIKELGK